jgi:hypothetical protein
VRSGISPTTSRPHSATHRLDKGEGEDSRETATTHSLQPQGAAKILHRGFLSHPSTTQQMHRTYK